MASGHLPWILQTGNTADTVPMAGGRLPWETGNMTDTLHGLTKLIEMKEILPVPGCRGPYDKTHSFFKS